MPRRRTQPLFWTPERDRRLRDLWAQVPRPQLADMAEEFGISPSYVSTRAADLDLPRRAAPPPPPAWTDELNARLRELWVATPRVRLDAIGRELGFTASAISAQAMRLELPKRNPKAGGYTYTKSTPHRRGRKCAVESAEASVPRVVVHAAFTPCPYVDPRASLDPVTRKAPCCGVMVDRRPRRDGSRPSQYCKDRAPRVTPIAAGMSIGAGSRAGSRLLNAGAKVGGVLG